MKYSLRRGLLFYFFIVGLTANLYAQEKSTATSHLLVDSNFDSLYVVIDGELISDQKISDRKLINFEAGKHSITVIPEFAPTYRFEGEFLADSFYVATINFGFILSEQNPEYKKLTAGNLPAMIFKENKRYSLVSGSFGIDTYSQSDYYSPDINKIDYHNTYLKITSNVDSLYVRKSAFEKELMHIASGDSVLIQPGNRQITLSHQNAEEWNIRRTFKKGSSNTLVHNFKLRKPTVETLGDNIATKKYYNANLIVISDDDSRIYLNGQEAGLGAVKIQQNTGPVKIVIKNPKTGTHTFTTKIANLPGDKATVVDAYTKPSKSVTRFLGIFPGAGQFYKKQRFKGSLITSGFLIFGGLAVINHLNYNDEFSEFNRLEGLYNSATDEQRALELGNMLERQQDVVLKRNNSRTAFFALASLFYAFNLYDAISNKPKSGFRSKTDLNIHLNSNTISGQNFSSISVNYAF